MKLGISMEYVLVRAAQEAAAFSGGDMRIEHLLLGILKLPEVRGSDVVSDSSMAEAFDSEAREVTIVADEKGWDTVAMQRLLRTCLSGEKRSSRFDHRGIEEQIDYILGSAAYHAQNDKNSDIITAVDVLGAILRHPSLMISSVLKRGLRTTEGILEMKSGEDTPESGDSVHEPEGIAYLPALTARLRDMKYYLLGQVFGQEHAVHALAEGLFSAQVLSASDTHRKGPKAVFVFAGPPGVGKTFMAEQAASSLGLPYKIFDMSSYADHQAHIGLIGYAPSFKDAKAGLLTGFADEHPRSLLIIDEVEKAHRNTTQLFLQILDGGRLHDDYTDKDVDFRDTIIIFTTNAGRQLYEGSQSTDLSALPRQSILSALQTDTDPATGQPYFPPAICSRLAAGFVLMFNHLSAYDLERICDTELKRFCGLFEKQYSISISYDRRLPDALMFAEGACADARTLRAMTELFCKREVYRLCGMWDEDHFEEGLKGLRSIQICMDVDEAEAEVKELFVDPDRPRMLVFAPPEICTGIQEKLPSFTIITASSAEEAFELAGKEDPLFVLSDISTGIRDSHLCSVAADNPGWAEMAFLKTWRERLPQIPLYLLETDRLPVDEDFMNELSRLGVRGMLQLPDQDYDVFTEQMESLAGQCYLQRKAGELAARMQILTFDTRPEISEDRQTARIHLKQLTVKMARQAEDFGDLLDDVERSSTHFADVIGADEAKEELGFFAGYLKNPKSFMSRGLKPPKGILLYGPPGTGKTMLARAMAGEADAAFIATQATSFVTKWQGSGPESIRNLFRKARRYAPSIIFIDEIDAVGRTRGGSNTGHGEEMALNALLAEMDGFHTDPSRPVFVLAATNYSVEDNDRNSPGSIDPALSRRFDRKILVELPDREKRLEYLIKMTAGDNNKVSAEMLERIAGRSAGMSLADLSTVLEQAARSALRNNSFMGDEDLDEAYERIRHGTEKNWGNEYMERVAYHESGHALLTFLTGKTPSYLTIIARGGHGGYMEHSDTENTPLRTRQELRERIRTALGGRAAEQIRYGEEEGISTGASGDLEQATRLAAALLLDYGMDKSFGMASMSLDVLMKGPLAEKIIDGINSILDEELKNAVHVLEEHKEELEKLAAALLDNNKLTGEEIRDILT